MKKFIFFALAYIMTSIVAISFIVSCNNDAIETPQIQSDVVKVEETDSLELLNIAVGRIKNHDATVEDTVHINFCDYENTKLCFFLSRFIMNNPDCFNNEIAEKTYSDVLKKEFDKVIKSDSTFIMDVVVSYDDIVASGVKTDNGKTAYIVGFNLGNSGRGFFSDDKYDYWVGCTIVGCITKQDFIKINKDSTYRIKGVITKRVDKDYNGNKFGIYGHQRNYKSTRNFYGKYIELGCFFIKDLQLTDVYDNI